MYVDWRNYGQRGFNLGNATPKWPTRSSGKGQIVSEEEIIEERRRLARKAMEMLERSGEEATREKLAAEMGIARTRVTEIFPEKSDLREAVTAEWFAPKLALIDEVMASDLPPRRKMYEFFARRFLLLRSDFHSNPSSFRIYVEMGENYFEHARSYIDLADHFTCELIAEAQAEGYMPGLEINEALSLINQTVVCYIQPYLVALLDDRLSDEKLARIIDALFDGLSGEDRGALPLTGLSAVS